MLYHPSQGVGVGVQRARTSEDRPGSGYPIGSAVRQRSGVLVVFGESPTPKVQISEQVLHLRKAVDQPTSQALPILYTFLPIRRDGHGLARRTILSPIVMRIPGRPGPPCRSHSSSTKAISSLSRFAAITCEHSSSTRLESIQHLLGRFEVARMQRWLGLSEQPRGLVKWIAGG